ncbi:methylenetetrahydrofolate reductase [Amorphus sp. 3PC139-8]|uniref:methylenetetrahydrofolate reductase n=1 Tax=Amorphus sp. 3PC139-8 TaxID=2735676 RepID=UPI00345D24F9
MSGRDENSNKIAASIEISPKQAIESSDLPGLFPDGVRVYVTDVGSDPTATLVEAAKRVRDLGYVPVPHIAARRLTTTAAFEERIRALTEEVGVNEVLIIGGGLDKPTGDFASTMTVLETGMLERFGIKEIGVAGHPEGSPDFSEDTAYEALRLKQTFGEQSGIKVRIVTQFGFDPDQAIKWAMGLKEHGVELPIHLGVAGPAKTTTLIKYAAMCGVGNSVNFLRKHSRSLVTLATSHSPESVVGPIEQHVIETPASPIKQIHVFPFGGIKKAAHWLEERGSWPTERQNVSMYTL